jgi:heat shock protein HslJ
MRLHYLALALLAAATPAAAQPPAPEGEIYSGFGSEPFWGLTFEDGKIVFTENEERIEVPRPRPTTTPAGVHIYRTPRFAVEISHEGRCNDGMGEYEYSDTVRIRFGRSRTARPYEGCGGELLPPATLAGSDWYLVDVNGVIVGGETYVLRFDDAGRLSGQAGCNRFSGPYTQRGHLLIPGAIAATRMACPGGDTSPEARMMQLLRGSILINYRGGMIMTLQENNGGGPAIFATLRRN